MVNDTEAEARPATGRSPHVIFTINPSNRLFAELTPAKSEVRCKRQRTPHKTQSRVNIATVTCVAATQVVIRHYINEHDGPCAVATNFAASFAPARASPV